MVGLNKGTAIRLKRRVQLDRPRISYGQSEGVEVGSVGSGGDGRPGASTSDQRGLERQGDAAERTQCPESDSNQTT